MTKKLRFALLIALTPLMAGAALAAGPGAVVAVAVAAVAAPVSAADPCTVQALLSETGTG